MDTKGSRVARTVVIKIQVVRHHDTGLLMAFSPDLKGLLVPGRSEKDLEQKLPAAIREILEAEGNRVTRVEAMPDPDERLGDFATPAFIANAQLAAA